MVKHAAASVFLLLYHVFSCQGQALNESSPRSDFSKNYYLVLDKPGKVSRLRFYPGSQLSFKLTNDKMLYSGRIDAVRQQSIVIFNTELPIRNIRKIKVRQRAPTGRFLYGLGSSLRGVGILFTLVGSSNYLLTSDRENGRVTALAGLTTLGVGQLFRGFNRRTYKINKHRQLKTIEII